MSLRSRRFRSVLSRHYCCLLSINEMFMLQQLLRAFSQDQILGENEIFLVSFGFLFNFFRILFQSSLKAKSQRTSAINRAKRLIGSTSFLFSAVYMTSDRCVVRSLGIIPKRTGPNSSVFKTRKHSENARTFPKCYSRIKST